MSSGFSLGVFLDRVIDDGIAGASADYEAGSEKLRGSVAGFEACRGRDPEQLASLLAESRRETMQAFREQAPDYWYWRCRELEVEWVCNVVSAAFLNEGWAVIVPPTVRGVMRAAEILGVAAS